MCSATALIYMDILDHKKKQKTNKQHPHVLKKERQFIQGVCVFCVCVCVCVSVRARGRAKLSHEADVRNYYTHLR